MNKPSHPARRYSDHPQAEDDFEIEQLLGKMDVATTATADIIKQCRAVLTAGQQQLAERFQQGQRATRLIRHQAQIVDALIVTLWQKTLGKLRVPTALIAVGGYGRGELHPGSDVDLLILIDQESSLDQLQSAIEQLVTLLWDIGLEVGHSVRTVGDCLREAKDDITVITSLIESRLLTGNNALYKNLCEAITPEKLWPADAFFIAKCEEQKKRHHKFRDTAFNLEPNIKEGPGGLRDLQVIVWVTRRHFGSNLEELVNHGFLTTPEHDELIRCQDYLWQVRYALHTQTGRNENRLLFDLQRELAIQFGYRDDENAIAVEKFMQAYYRAITSLNRLNEMLLQLFEEAILLTGNGQKTLSLNRRFCNSNGFLAVKDPAIFWRYPFALLEGFLLLQQHPELKGVRAETIRQIRHYRHLIDAAFRDDLRCRSLFLEILRQPAGKTHELRRMNRYGILAAYCVPFAAIVGRMQYDLFHAYTVDEHTLRVIDNVHAFSHESAKKDFPLCYRVMNRIPKREILYIAALFHDIAKGRGGSHSQLGAVDAREFCQTHGLSDYDTALVVWLVREHLVMSATAQQRDIDDPAVIDEFGRKVNDENYLNHLFLLTVADIRGTNPDTWNNWKASLIDGLYNATRRLFRQGPENALDQLDELHSRQRQAREQLSDLSGEEINRVWRRLDDSYFVRHSAGEITWHTRTLHAFPTPSKTQVMTRNDPQRNISQLLTFGPDSHGLLALMAITLERLALNIVDARIVTTQDGFALNTFVILDSQNQGPLTNDHLQEIADSLRQSLANKPLSIQLRPQTRRQRHFVIPTEVLFSDDLQNRYTLVHLTTADRPGLLAAITQIFADQSLRVCNARITTFGARVEDTFYITDEDAKPLSQSHQFDDLRQRIIECLDASNNGH